MLPSLRALATGAAFDNPDLIVAAVVGDGEAETGPLATSWHSNKFLNPARDGAVLPILHLNGYKIAGPTVLARISDEELDAIVPRLRLRALFRRRRRARGSSLDPAPVHQQMAATLDKALAEIRQIQDDARQNGFTQRPRWPMIILRTPKGWTGPHDVDGKPVEGTFRSHQVPMGDMDKPEHIQILETWMKSYRPQELFDADGQVQGRAGRAGPQGPRAA